MNDPDAWRNELVPFLQQGFAPGTKDVIVSDKDGLIHDPTFEVVPQEIDFPPLAGVYSF
jgi:hypothetical protein